MRDALSVATPYVRGLDISKRHNAETILRNQQQQLATAVGILRYLVDSSRTDLARAVRQSTARHVRALRQVARFM